MYKVLIIDNDPRILQVTQALLEILAGWTALTATSGKEGLVLAQQEKPDAILLDVKMPGMNGVETLQYLQQHPETQSIPVILFTSVAQDVIQQKFAHLTIAGIVPKPYDAAQLVEKIRDLLHWK